MFCLFNKNEHFSDFCLIYYLFLVFKSFLKWNILTSLINTILTYDCVYDSVIMQKPLFVVSRLLQSYLTFEIEIGLFERLLFDTFGGDYSVFSSVSI